MTKNKQLRIIDANINRISEGLRVLEDISRYVLNDYETGMELRKLRHFISIKSITKNINLLASRDIQNDYGRKIRETNNKQLLDLIISNSKRVQEGLRVLEELSKIKESGLLDYSEYKSARFKTYNLEQAMVSKILHKNKINKLAGLNAIIDTSFIKFRQDIITVTNKLLELNIKVIHYRDIINSKDKIFNLANQLCKICHGSDALFILFDHFDIALATEADGLNTGANFIHLKNIRNLMPLDMIIGYNFKSKSDIRNLIKLKPDYIIYSLKKYESPNNLNNDTLEYINKINSLKLPIILYCNIDINTDKRIISSLYNIGITGIAPDNLISINKSQITVNNNLISKICNISIKQ